MSKNDVFPINFIPADGILLVDPNVEVKKSDSFAVADDVDDPHRGIVVAIGAARLHDGDPKIKVETSAKVGDLIVYSMVGCEKTRLFYNGDHRYQFIIVPFGRLLGTITEEVK